MRLNRKETTGRFDAAQRPEVASSLNSRFDITGLELGDITTIFRKFVSSRPAGTLYASPAPFGGSTSGTSYGSDVEAAFIAVLEGRNIVFRDPSGLTLHAHFWSEPATLASEEQGLLVAPATLALVGPFDSAHAGVTWGAWLELISTPRKLRGAPPGVLAEYRETSMAQRLAGINDAPQVSGTSALFDRNFVPSEWLGQNEDALLDHYGVFVHLTPMMLDVLPPIDEMETALFDAVDLHHISPDHGVAVRLVEHRGALQDNSIFDSWHRDLALLLGTPANPPRHLVDELAAPYLLPVTILGRYAKVETDPSAYRPRRGISWRQRTCVSKTRSVVGILTSTAPQSTFPNATLQ